MSRILCIVWLMFLIPGPAAAESVRIPAIADIWVSQATARERETGAGGSVVFKLKSVQELAAVRFDLEAIEGREILGARLHLRSRGEHAPRRLRVSTVTSRWTEGKSARAYSGRDGATWNHADAARGKNWTWPGSVFADVCMGAGHSLVEVVDLSRGEDGWGDAEIPLDLIRAMVSGASDGLALMEAGTPRNRNYYFHSAQSWESKPWLELELGKLTREAPPAPVIWVEPAPARATSSRSAVWLGVRADSTDFAWKGWLNGEALDPWQLPRVGGRGDLRWPLDDLPPRSELQLELRAVSASGAVSSATRIDLISPPARPAAPSLAAPPTDPPALRREQAPTLWALPPLSRIDPRDGTLLTADPRDGGELPWNHNPVWDGLEVKLRGARGERLAFSLLVSRRACGPAARVRIRPSPLRSRGRAPLRAERWSLRETWYRPRDEGWEGHYLRPARPDAWIENPSPDGLPADAAWRSFRAELAVPADAGAGVYRGEFVVEFECGRARLLRVQVEVSSLSLAPASSFRVELNAYRVPENALEYFRLARAHRAVFTPWVVTPELSGEVPELEVDWQGYDAQLASLLDGSAFGEEDPRPLELLYLPFWESWPVRLEPQYYAFPEPWPQRGDPFQSMWDHHETAPRIEEAFSAEYLAALHAVREQFLDHFAQREWHRTELHAFYGSKMSHFTRYGRRSFWNTDEPLYLADWEALRFFLHHFDTGLTLSQREHWLTRADISRPEWMEGALGDAARIVYTGGKRSAAEQRRMSNLSTRLGFRWLVYGSASSEDQEPSLTAAWALEAFLDGAEGALVWLSLGDRNSWREIDPEEFPGTALMAEFPQTPGPVGDLRLLALREAQQLIGWLEAIAAREGLVRAQLDPLLRRAFQTETKAWWHGIEDEESPIRRGFLHAHEIERLRHLLAERWETGPDLK